MVRAPLAFLMGIPAPHSLGNQTFQEYDCFGSRSKEAVTALPDIVPIYRQVGYSVSIIARQVGYSFPERTQIGGFIMIGRKIEKEEKRTHCVMVRFNDFEFQEVCDRAEEAGLSVAAYVRQQAFYKDLVRHYNIVQDPEEIKSLVSEFGKIGVNLNQIARFFNTGGMRSLEMEDDIHDCISMLFQLRKRVLQLGGDHYGSNQASGE